MAFTQWKKFFEAAIFESLSDVLFDRVKKLIAYFGLHEFSLHSWRTEVQMNTAYEK